MATLTEINEAKRAELDVIAVEYGLDPAQYSKVEDLRTAVLAEAGEGDNAPDKDPDNDPDNDGGEGEDTPDNVPTDMPVTATVPDAAELAARQAETPVVTRAASSVIGSPMGFDEYGQPKFRSDTKAE